LSFASIYDCSTQQEGKTAESDAFDGIWMMMSFMPRLACKNERYACVSGRTVGGAS